MAQLQDGFVLRVSTEALAEKANSVEELVRKMTAEFDEMESLLSETGSYWLGRGGDSKRKTYTDRKETIHTMLTRLMEYPGDLMKIAGVYREGENKNQEETQVLSGDAII